MKRNEKFLRWWDEIGFSLDPDTSDVPWFDKRKGLAEMAFMAGEEKANELSPSQAAVLVIVLLVQILWMIAVFLK